MINSLCGSMGSLKSEHSFSKLQPTSSNESIMESKKTVTAASADLEQTSLTPSALNLQALKFEAEGEMEVQSPDRSFWESFFTEQFDSDFMVSSPVRNQPPSPQVSNFNYNYNVANAMHESLLGCSPPRSSSTVGAFSSSISHKGKGLSPLHRVFNSPTANHFMGNEGLSLLPDLDGLLDDEFGAYPAVANLPLMLDCLTPSSGGGSSRFCGSLSENSPASQERDIYQASSLAGTPLLQQLRQEQQQEQQQRHVGHNHSLMAPLPVNTDKEHDSGLQLVHLLLACAEAVAKEDYMLARRYLHHLNRIVTPLGDSMQRVASFFTDALSARLAATLTTNPTTSAQKPYPPFPPNSIEILKIYQILYQACPYIKFAHFTANQAIFEAFEEEERVHVIDLDILQGYQWPAFMQALAARPGGAPFLRITGVGTPAESVRETGRCLSELAHSLHVPFEFHPVGEQLEDLKPHMFNRRVGEALAVNSVGRLHRVPGNSLSNLLTMIRGQAPNIVTIVEQEASHNGPYFLGRFLEALHYYSAIFDSLDATFPVDSAQRSKVEEFIFAPEIRNIVACEGAERVVRHERLEKWRKIMEGKGFKGVALSGNAVTQSKILLGLYSCDGYRLTEETGCLLLGWQDRAILAASAWRC